MNKPRGVAGCPGCEELREPTRYPDWMCDAHRLAFGLAVQPSPPLRRRWDVIDQDGPAHWPVLVARVLQRREATNGQP